MERRVSVERDGELLMIGLDRPEKRNAADLAMLEQLAAAYGQLDSDASLRVGVVHSTSEHFTAGLDLADIAPRIGADGLRFIPDGGLDPWGLTTRPVRKPVVLAVSGICYTLGIELALASDVVVADRSTSFAQLEVARAILPFGGATLRFARAAGWSNAMRWMLTGDAFDAEEALRMRIVTEIVENGTHVARAVELARRIAAAAPLAVQATLANARLAVAEGDAAAASALPAELVRLAGSDDARAGMEAFLTRTTPRFEGR